MPPQGRHFFRWRRRRDSNPRYAINVYSLSRGAPSATRPLLQILFIYFLSNVSLALPGRALLGALHLALRVAAAPPALLRSLGLLGQPLGHFSRFCLCRFYKCRLFLMSLFPYQIMSYTVLSSYLRIAAYRSPRRLSYLFRTEVPRQVSRCTILNFVQGSRSDATPHSARSALKRSDTGRLWAATRTS